MFEAILSNLMRPYLKIKVGGRLGDTAQLQSICLRRVRYGVPAEHFRRKQNHHLKQHPRLSAIRALEIPFHTPTQNLPQEDG